MNILELSFESSIVGNFFKEVTKNSEVRMKSFNMSHMSGGNLENVKQLASN